MPNEECVYKKITDNRPWGLFTQYTYNQNTTVKIIEVRPGGKLSVQRHKHRDELWIILSPNLWTSINDTDKLHQVNDEVWIPKGTVHTIENKGRHWGSFLEISFGIFDEEDIERLTDKYGRS